MGEGPVYFVLGDHQPETCNTNQPLTFSNFKIWKVDSGETFDLRNRPTQGFYQVSVSKGELSSTAF